MKIGVVGSGIAGLVSAWLLSRAGHDVVVFEKSERVGLGGASLSNNRSPSQIDVPLRLFNAKHWRRLSQLYAELGIKTEQVSLSQSFWQEQGDGCRQLDMDSLFSAPVSALWDRDYRSILLQARKLREVGSADLPKLSSDLEFAEYLEQRGFHSDFTDQFLYPVLAATVCTCSVTALRKYPAATILQLLANITPTGSETSALFRVQGGIREVEQRLMEEIPEVRTRSTATSIVRDQNVEVTLATPSGSVVEQFDHVVLATQANHLSRLLQRPTQMERQMFSCFEYEEVEIIVHSDDSFMPSYVESWSAFNFCRPAANDVGADPMCTIWLNRFSEQYSQTLNMFQTIKPTRRPAEEHIHAERKLERPIVSRSSRIGWQLLERMHSEPERNVWFAGSYAANGVPLLETAVQSAIAVAQRLRVENSMIADLIR